VSFQEPEDYSVISLLSVLGKIISEILAGRLRDCLLNNEVFLAFHTGCMKGKSHDNVFMIKTTLD
jgi:hypothetical protein